MDTDVVDREDVRVIQRGGSAGFLIESRKASRVAGEGRRQHFDRDITSEPRVSRPIDFAHAARAGRYEDFVGTEARAGSKGQRCGVIIRARRGLRTGAVPQAGALLRCTRHARERSRATTPAGESNGALCQNCVAYPPKPWGNTVI